MGKDDERIPPALSFRARIFVALVGISSVTSLIIGLVLYYFAQDRLVHEEKRAWHAGKARWRNSAPRRRTLARMTSWKACATRRTRRFPRLRPTLNSSSSRSPTRRASRYSTSDPASTPWPPATV